MNATIYTIDNCIYCVKAKNTLQNRGVMIEEIKVGQDISREDFLEKFPNVRTVPQIIIDGKLIGGWDDLRNSEFYANANQG